MTEPGAYGGPTALRIMLGAHLRRLREQAGISRSDAGWAIRGSESKISRLELGRVGFKVRDVDDLLTLYKLTDQVERDRLLELATQANDPGWWQRWDDLTPTWFHSYLGLEMAAELIRTFELQFVPGLLQTPDYMRAVVQLGRDRPLPGPEVERLVALRTGRQQILTRKRSVRFWAVIDEAGTFNLRVAGHLGLTDDAQDTALGERHICADLAALFHDPIVTRAASPGGKGAKGRDRRNTPHPCSTGRRPR